LLHDSSAREVAEQKFKKGGVVLKRKYRWMGLNILELHFHKNITQFLQDQDLSNIDVIVFYQVTENYQNKLNDFATLQFDLKLDEDEIFRNIRSKNTRNEIRKNIRDDGIDYLLVENLSNNDIDNFIHDLNWFMKEKNKDTNIGFIKNQIKSFVGNIVLTHAIKDDITLASHLYLFDNERVRYTLGISYRHKGIDPSLVGRSNRGLHWFDIKLFKKRNFKIYDFGGIALNSNSADEKNIRKFKESFTRNTVHEYQGNIGLSIKGKLALSLHNLKKKISNGRTSQR